MTLARLPDDPRLHELLAGRALGDLDATEQRELDELAARYGINVASLDDSSLDLVAGAMLAAGLPGSADPLPAQLREKLFKAADEFLAERQAEQGRTARGAAAAGGRAPADVVGRIGDARPRSGASTWVGWFAAAAAIILAAVAWLRPTPGTSVTSPESLVAGAPDIVRASWGDWDKPEIAGVTGEVVWSDSRQAGYMKFRGLPANDPDRQQYQLWIVDERGLVDPTGQSARISGGVFDVPPAAADGSVVVPITPALKVGNAKLFALTIEKPGGTWVSDMTRRVVIASVGQ